MYIFLIVVRGFFLNPFAEIRFSKEENAGEIICVFKDFSILYPYKICNRSR